MTTVMGLIGLAGTVVAGVGYLLPSAWSPVLIAVGLALKGADSVGNLYSKDASK